jgi:hypothetical protein
MATPYSSASSGNAFTDIAFSVHQYLSLRLESLFRGTDKDDAAKAHAIAVLGDNDAGPDLKDWAERYLCGLAGRDPAKYLENRKWQG